MLIMCGKKNSLVCSLTRMVHFGPLPDKLKHKMEASDRVKAAFIKSIRLVYDFGGDFQQRCSYLCYNRLSR
jgi:hypothetical protein